MTDLRWRGGTFGALPADQRGRRLPIRIRRDEPKSDVVSLAGIEGAPGRNPQDGAPARPPGAGSCRSGHRGTSGRGPGAGYLNQGDEAPPPTGASWPSGNDGAGLQPAFSTRCETRQARLI
jgi:hypothetical protein